MSATVAPNNGVYFVTSLSLCGDALCLDFGFRMKGVSFLLDRRSIVIKRQTITNRDAVEVFQLRRQRCAKQQHRR